MIASTQANTKVGFEYGPGRERIRRLDYRSALATSAQSLTHFVGSAEIRCTANGTSPGAFEEVRRYVGGVILVQRGSGTNQTTRRSPMRKAPPMPYSMTTACRSTPARA